MKMVLLVLNLAGGASGLFAAWLWWGASRVTIRPEIQPDGMETEAWVAAARNALQRSSYLNAQAALLTAISVMLFSIGSILGLSVQG